MGKHKTAQELMAERNPLTRTPVAPIDIYTQTLEPPQESETQEAVTASSGANSTQVQSSETPVHQETDDRIRPYSTYLRQSQVKGIKLRAIDREIDDKDIVQEAIDEYFNNHSLL